MSASGEKQTPKNRTYTVEDIAAILGIGKSSAYKLANSGEFQTIRIGNMIEKCFHQIVCIFPLAGIYGIFGRRKI